MTELERRYLRLLWAYPAAYRRARGAEIVGTYLDLAAPGRRWPTPADAVDLARGGLAARLRAAGATDLLPGVRLAAALAFVTATALAAIWTVLEVQPPNPEFDLPTFGQLHSVGVVVWAAWLLAALAYALAPHRVARATRWAAVLLTALVTPVAALAGLPRPPLLLLVPQLVLGLVALGLPRRPPVWARVAPLLVAALAAAVGVHWFGREVFGTDYYGFLVLQAPVVVAVVLLLATIVLALDRARRRDFRGGWALLILLTPIGLLAVRELAGSVERNPDWATLAATAAAVGLLGPGLLLAALTARLQVLPERPTPPCPTCGSSR
ncbi:hypothetical protein K7640_19060 [Micromonospora sp. PLK6-60]|uniref:hypothetical protein n=1 Tax=Micromonospora sp. PLK6-60 TaxID=2873383 RepID=UPI001CA78D1A|nr:hypothetical protein [Micromonospora sp. PLK6-60]MBY8873933.1 hypothetical protein [Micromonospora sp. PLK6-60]